SGVGFRPEGGFSREGDGVEPAREPALELALRVGSLANRASLAAVGGRWEIRGDPTEAALLVAARKAGLDRERLLERWPEVGEVPFSSERMLLATFHRGPDRPEAYVKGAPARVIECGARLLGPAGEEAPLDDDTRATILERNDAMAAGGLRVLALARGAADSAEEGALRDLTLVGLVGMSDPPAAGVL